MAYDQISDDRLISAWVTAMHAWIVTGSDEWEFHRQMLDTELCRRKLGRKRLHLEFDHESFDAETEGLNQAFAVAYDEAKSNAAS